MTMANAKTNTKAKASASTALAVVEDPSGFLPSAEELK